MSIEVKEKEIIKEILKEPSLYNVIFHNDDYTTQEFVIEVLVEIFHKNFNEAQQLMMEVHNKGASIVGTYSYDIALTKLNHVTRLARSQGFPLKVTVEEAQ